MKKKTAVKKEESYPKASARKKTLVGTLKHSGIEVKISVKKIEDWAKFLNYYFNHRDRLCDDLLPFMLLGASISNAQTTKHKDQHIKDSLKVFSAILYHLCEQMKKIDHFPVLLKPLQTDESSYDVAALLMNYVFMNYFAKIDHFENIFDIRNRTYKVKVKPFSEAGMATDNFVETYVNGGEKLIRSADPKILKGLIRTADDILTGLPTWNSLTGGRVSFDKKSHNILIAISNALTIQFRDPAYGTLLPGKRSSVDVEVIEFIRDVLRPICPTIPMPDGILQ